MYDLVYEDGSVAMDDIIPGFNNSGFCVVTTCEKPYSIKENESKNLENVFLSKDGTKDPIPYILSSISYSGDRSSKEAVLRYDFIKVVKS